MSTLIRFSSESKISLANILAKCVLPTPVGPRNMNEPIGFSGFFNPALFLCMALETFATASLWPIILLSIEIDRLFNLFF